MTETTAVCIERIVVPDSLDAPDADAFRAIWTIWTISNAVCRHDAGHGHFDHDAREMLPSWHDQTDQLQIGFVASRDDRDLGVLTMAVPLEAAATNIEFDIMVHPAHWDEGVEQALLAVLENEARTRGRGVLQTWTMHRRELEVPQLAPTTGRGSIPADDRQTCFMRDNGFTFEQTERNSVFDLTSSLENVEQMLAAAIDFAGTDYRIVEWSIPTPGEFADRFAQTIARMSTDVPTGNLVWPEEAWDAARVQRRDKSMQYGGNTVSVVCIEHVPTGVLAAYNELVIGADHTASTHQWGTLVLTEHRGRRLGTIVKCANILRWHDLVPDSPVVSTFNAEENRPMLDINEAIGFVPASYAGAWKKVLDA